MLTKLTERILKEVSVSETRDERRALRIRYIGDRTKMRIFKVTALLVVTYGTDTMTITNRDKEKLRIYERKINKNDTWKMTQEKKENSSLMNH